MIGRMLVKNSMIARYMPSEKTEGFLIVFFISLLILISTSIIAHASGQPSVSVKTYSINPVAFRGYQTVSDINKIPIIFCAYGEKTKVVYPAPKDNIIKDSSAISRKCGEAILQNVDKIVKVQSQDQSVREYLTADNKIAPLTKYDFLNIVNHPQEFTFQNDASANRSIAEFRSKEFSLDGNESFCIYITFICASDNASVEEIIISAVKLES